MILTKAETQEVAVPDYLQCNVCARQWSLDPESKDIWEAQEAAEITLDGGYGNNHWGDLTRIRFHACQDCVAAWIRTFQVAPEAWELSIHGRPRGAVPFALRPFPASPPEDPAEPPVTEVEKELFFELGDGEQ